MKSETKNLLGVALPTQASNVRFENVPESYEWKKPYYAYISAEMSEDAYVSYVEFLGLSIKERNGGEFQFLLPGEIKGDSGAPDWWLITDSNNLPATGPFPEAEGYGFIVATYENGAAYIKVYEQEPEDS